MIVRVKFKAKVGKYSRYDDIDIFVAKKNHAETIFNSWLNRGVAIRGNSGVFHLNIPYGAIKFKSAKELKDKPKDFGR